MADLKPRTPLPPGMVPSGSGEDLPNILEDGEKQREQQTKDIVQDGSLSRGSSGRVDTNMSSRRTTQEPSNSPPEAWRSPQDQQTNLYQIDLSGNEEDASDGVTQRIPVFEGISTPELGKSPRKKLWSPFSRSNKVQAIDLRDEVLSRGNVESFSEQTPSKRILSPFKKNKVAPSPAKQPAQAEDSTASPFVSKTQPAVERVLTPVEVGVPVAALMADIPKLDLNEDEATTTDEPPLTPKVIVTTNQNDPIHAASSSLEGLYSSVVKPKKPASGDQVQVPEEITVISQQQATLDTSLVIENQDVQGRVSDDISTDDHAYEMVDAPNTDVPDMPVYSASVYKELKKHQDVGNVHLVSVKGATSNVPSVQNFPEGSSSDMHPLHYAAASGDKKKLAQLLSVLPITQDPVEMVLGTEKMCGRDGLEVTDSEGRTPIMHAVHNNHIQSVKMLAEVGANVNAMAIDGSTCLHQASYSGSIDMVALLLSLGADGLKTDNDGRTPLHWCTNNTTPETIDHILDKVPGLSVDARDGAMMTPLMWAAFHGHQQHVLKLLQRGAEPQQTDIDGMTAAHWSVQRHDTRTLQVLVSPESATYKDSNGKTIMHQAAERGSSKAVSLIKAVKPTSVNDQDVNGRTPLHWATACENPDALKTLLALGANPNVKDFSGFTALEYANQKGFHYCALLLKQSEDQTDGYQAIPTYGTTTAGFGSRALQQQGGELLNMEDVENMLTKEQIAQIQSVCNGSWLNKFSSEGRGSTHSRLFWVNPSNTKICWAKEKDANQKDVKSDILVGVKSSASPTVFGRKDFDPMNKHKYSFTIFTSSRVIDVVAASSEDYKTWLNGLQMLLNLGSVNATRLLSIVQNASGEFKPIP